MKQAQKRMIIAGSIVLGIAMLVFLWLHYRSLLAFLHAPTFNRTAFIAEFRGKGWVAMVPLALLLMTISVIPGAPNSVIAVLNGVCLGAPMGFVTNVIGLTLGNSLGSLLVTRLEDLSKRQQSSRVLTDLLKMRHPRFGVALAYSVPFIPNTLVHIAAAKLHIDRPHLEELICIGSLPTAFFYAFGGDAVLHLNVTRLVIAAALIAASAGIITLIHKDTSKQKG